MLRTGAAGSTPAGRLPVTFVWSPHPWRPELTRAVVGDDPLSLLVEYDLERLGSGQVVRRTTTGAGESRSVERSSRHHCLACLLRDDLLPHLAELADPSRATAVACVIPDPLEVFDVLAVLPDARLDDRPVADLLRFDAAVAVVDVPGLVDEGLLPGRTFRHIVSADVLALTGTRTLAPDALRLVGDLLDRVNPQAARLALEPRSSTATTSATRLTHTPREGSVTRA